MTTQSEKAQYWLARHGIAGVPEDDTGSLQASSVLAGEQPQQEGQHDEDDWATDAQRWYLQRAQGVDVAQLLPYHQTAGK